MTTTTTTTMMMMIRRLLLLCSYGFVHVWMLVEGRISISSSLNQNLSGTYVRGVVLKGQQQQQHEGNSKYYAHTRHDTLSLFSRKKHQQQQYQSNDAIGQKQQRWFIGEDMSSESVLAYIDTDDPCRSETTVKNSLWMVANDGIWVHDDNFQIICHGTDPGGVHACSNDYDETEGEDFATNTIITSSGKVPCVTLSTLVESSDSSSSINTVRMPLVLLGTAYISASHGAGAANPNVVESAPAIEAALDMGYQGFDLGSELHPAYANERLMGDLLQLKQKDNNNKRESTFITTKLSPNEHGYESTYYAVQRSLKLLQIDTIDLYLIHHPQCLMVEQCQGDWKDSWKAIEELYRMGVFRAVGVSNFDFHLLSELLDLATVPISVLQNRADPLAMEDPNLLRLCNENNIHYQAFSVLGRQWVVGPWSEYWRSQHPILDHPDVVQIANRLSNELSPPLVVVEPAQIILRWAIQQGWSVLPKTANATRLESNRRLFFFELTQNDMEIMNHLVRPPRIMKNEYDTTGGGEL